MAEATDDTRPNDRSERLRALGQAIRRFREARGLTQGQLGEQLVAVLDEAVPQTTISRWEGGTVSIDYETVRAIEITLNLPLGTIAATATYVEPGVEPPVDVVKAMYMTDRRDAMRATRDADNLGFGVRLTNILWPDRDIPDGWTQHWCLEVLAEAPERNS